MRGDTATEASTRASWTEDQVVLITGALTGIGRATALAFAREGDQIVISGRHGEAGEELAHFVLRTTRIADGTCRFGGRPYEAGYIPGSGMTSMISIHAPGICR